MGIFSRIPESVGFPLMVYGGLAVVAVIVVAIVIVAIRAAS